MSPNTFRCTTNNCGWQGLFAETLHAPNPFEPDNEVIGCPKCEKGNSLSRMCDEPGCRDNAEWVGPDPKVLGSRHTCGRHVSFA